MKLQKAFTLVLLISLCLSIFPAFAAYEALEVTATVDYSRKTIDVDILSTSGYPQSMIVVLYSAAAVTPGWANYIRATEILSDDDGNCVAAFQTGGDIGTGDYIIAVTGGGSSSPDFYAAASVHILSDKDTADILDAINRANETSIEGYLNQAAATLKLDTGVNYTSHKADWLSRLIHIRADDYAGNFPNLTAVGDAFRLAGILIELGNAVNAAGVLNMLEANASLFGIDINSADYSANSTGICSVFLSLNNKAPAKSAKVILNYFNEAVAVGAINGSDITIMETSLKKYSKVLGITDYLSDYEKADKIKVARQLYNKEFKSAAAVAAAFSDAIRLAVSSGGPGNTIGNTGGGVSGLPGLSGSYANPGGNIQETPDSKKPFSDIDEFAWAEESIYGLRNSGIIDGYPDGSFRGNSPVTREELTKLAVAAFGIYKGNAKCDFSDVSPDDWFYSFLGSAQEAYVVTGYPDGSFGVAREISREDAALILFRAISVLSISLENKPSEISFSDETEISDYAFSAIKALRESNVINGFDDGSFRPQSALTRAEAAKLIFTLMGARTGDN